MTRCDTHIKGLGSGTMGWVMEIIQSNLPYLDSPLTGTSFYQAASTWSQGCETTFPAVQFDRRMGGTRIQVFFTSYIPIGMVQCTVFPSYGHFLV